MQGSCENLRSRGNELFNGSASEALSPVVRRARVQRACGFYIEALNSCNRDSDRAKCCKNLGASYWRLTKLGFDLLEGTSQVSQDDKHLIFNVLYSAKNYLAALEYGGKHPRQSRAWLANIEFTLEGMARTVVQRMRDLLLLGPSFSSEVEERMSLGPKSNTLLADLCKVFDAEIPPQTQASAILHKALAEQLFYRGVKLMKRNGGDSNSVDFRGCLALMAECHYPLKLAEAKGNDSDAEFVESIADLRGKISSQQRLCESVQARVAGDNFLEQALELDVENNSRKSLGYLALDKFKEAANLAKGVDVEAEAVALCGAGNVYSSVLNMQKNALPYYENSLELVKGDADRVVQAEWCRRANSALQKLRNIFHPPKVQEQMAQLDKQTKQAYEEVRSLLAELENQCKKLSPADFLLYLCKTHPPRKVDVKSLQPGNERMTRIALRRAISAYHPDRNGGQEDMKWTVLCQEITKNLLMKYKN